jgi:hypothetical protein
MTDIKYTVIELSDADVRRLTGQRPTPEEAEFRRVFGREPDVYDEEYGVAKATEEAQWLGEFMVGVAP